MWWCVHTHVVVSFAGLVWTRVRLSPPPPIDPPHPACITHDGVAAVALAPDRRRAARQGLHQQQVLRVLLARKEGAERLCGVCVFASEAYRTGSASARCAHTPYDEAMAKPPPAFHDRPPNPNRTGDAPPWRSRCSPARSESGSRPWGAPRWPPRGAGAGAPGAPRRPPSPCC